LYIVGYKTKTIEELVRVNAAKEHLRKDKHKSKHRRSGSAVHLRPLKSSQSSKRKMRAAQSQRELHEEDNVRNSEVAEDEISDDVVDDL